ncbi:MAG: VCBS repeat-containing protein [Planctomycetaceae bacterium]|nr:VCBS repeat-containing protein [Planctomycetaceae bacterium]
MNKHRHATPRLSRRARWLAAAFACAVLPGVWACSPVSQSPAPDEGAEPVAGGLSLGEVDEEMVSRITAFCSDCHGMPQPESFPRDRWHYEVSKGYEYHARSGRTDLDPPPLEATVAYYRSLAPEEPVFPKPQEADATLGTSFTVQKLMLAPEANAMPEISHLKWTRLAADHPQLVFSDMQLGIIGMVDLTAPNPLPVTVALLNNPCHAEPCDLNADGRMDLLVADQGGYMPYDHNRGRIVWLRQDEEGDLEPLVLASGLARVADLRPADFDGDGDLDMVVAEFGWYRTGRVLLLRDISEPGEGPTFQVEEIDDRPGAIHVPVCDLNDDGQVDFVALVSQEYESVDAFLNQGGGVFRLQTLWAGPDLTFGSSGIELVDLDQDGDTDVLYTNGDAFDNLYATPAHGVQWLENLGNMQFDYHRLTDMPGAYRALAGDMDLDGDLDVIVVAWLPGNVKPASVKAAPLASVICLEQVKPGVFVRHTLESESPFYATMEMADFDADGDLDFVTGPGPHITWARKDRHWLAVWRNQAVPDAAASR